MPYTIDSRAGLHALMWRGYLHRVQHKIFSFQPSQNLDLIAVINGSSSEIGASNIEEINGLR